MKKKTRDSGLRVDQSSEIMFSETLCKLFSIDRMDYEVLRTEMDEESVRNYPPSSKVQLQDIVQSYANALCNSVISNKELSLLVISVDVFATKLAIGDTCAQDRESTWREDLLPRVAILEVAKDGIILRYAGNH
jgi:hypothetical protein